MNDTYPQTWDNDDHLLTSAVLRRAYTVDLRQPVNRRRVDELLVQGDERSHQIAIRLTRGDAVVTPDSLNGYLMRADGATIVIPAASEDGCMVLPLPGSCLAVPGRAQLICRAVTDGDTTAVTVLWLDLLITPGPGDQPLTLNGSVTELDALLGHIGRIEQAAQAADASAAQATQAVSALRAELHDKVDTDTLHALLENRLPALIINSEPADSPVTVQSEAGTALMPRLYVQATIEGSGTPTLDNEYSFTGKDQVRAVVNGNTILINLPNACVGGYIDWRHGQYVQTHTLVTYTNRMDYGRNAQPNAVSFYREMPTRGVVEATSAFTMVPQTTYPKAVPGTCWISEAGTGIRFALDPTDERAASVASFRAWLATNPIVTLSRLPEPLVYDLDLPTLTAVDGANTIDHDGGGPIVMAYYGNLEHIINDLYAKLAALSGGAAG